MFLVIHFFLLKKVQAANETGLINQNLAKKQA
jgi:hypothetical protein